MPRVTGEEQFSNKHAIPVSFEVSHPENFVSRQNQSVLLHIFFVQMLPAVQLPLESSPALTRVDSPMFPPYIVCINIHKMQFHGNEEVSFLLAVNSLS